MTGLDEDLARDGAGDLLYKLLELRRAARVLLAVRTETGSEEARRQLAALLPETPARRPEGGAP